MERYIALNLRDKLVTATAQGDAVYMQVYISIALQQSDIDVRYHTSDYSNSISNVLTHLMEVSTQRKQTFTIRYYNTMQYDIIGRIEQGYI